MKTSIGAALVWGLLVVLLNPLARAESTVISPQDLLREALQVSVHIETPIRFTAVHMVALAQAKAGDAASSQRTFQLAMDMIRPVGDQGCVLGGVELTRIDHWATLAVDQGAAHLPDDMAQTFQVALQRVEQCDDGPKLDAYRNIAMAQARSGAGAAAEATLAKIYLASTGKVDSVKLKVQATSDVAVAYHKSGNRRQAESYRDRVVTLVGEALAAKPDDQPPYGLLYDLALLHARMGDSAATSTVFREIDTKWEKGAGAQTALSLVHALAESGHPESTLPLLVYADHATRKLLKRLQAERMHQDLVNMRGLPLWTQIAHGYARLGQGEAAIKSLRQMPRGYRDLPDDDYRAMAEVQLGNFTAAIRYIKKARRKNPGILADITRQQARLGWVTAAVESFTLLDQTLTTVPRNLEIHPRLQTHPDFLDTLRAVATARVTSGDIKRTVDWIRELPTPEERVFGLLGAAEGLTR
jgi:tetratricopeptide (TPR) repeat protein